MFNLKPRRTHNKIEKTISKESKILPSRRERLKHPVKTDIQTTFSMIFKKKI